MKHFLNTVEIVDNKIRYNRKYYKNKYLKGLDLNDCEEFTLKNKKFYLYVYHNDLGSYFLF